MRKCSIVVAVALFAVMMLPGIASAKVTDVQTYTWGGYNTTVYGPHINGCFDSSLKVYKNNATVYQLTPSDWETWYGWRAQRYLMIGKGDTITWRGVRAPAEEVLNNPLFVNWVWGGPRRFTAVMVQDKFDPMSYEVTEMIFP